MAAVTSKIDPVSNQLKDENRPGELADKIINITVAEMLKQGIIRGSTATWDSPICFMLRKTSSSQRSPCRFYIDYRQLNKAVDVIKKFPNPITLSRLYPLVKGRCFSILDCRQRYCHQFSINELDRSKTAFATSTGKWEFNFVPHGLCNGLSTFEYVISTILSGLRESGVTSYGDYIIISSSDVNSNASVLKEVLQILGKHHINLNQSGCVFGTDKIRILGQA